MKKISLETQKGISLIEVFISIAITTILVSVSCLNYSDYITETRNVTKIPKNQL